MNSISALQSGLYGINNGIQRLNKDAADIASATKPQSNTDLTSSLVNLNADQRQVEASTKVIKAQDEMLGTLLDITV
jgi:flagellar hook protein FlgE